MPVENLYKRGRVYYVRLQWKGRPIRKSTKTSSLAEARRFRDDLKEELRRLDKGHLPRKSFMDAVWRFHDEHLPNMKPQAADRYWVSLRAMEPHFGEMMLGAIGRSEISDYVSERRKTVKNATIRRDLACLSIMCECAIEWGWLDANPVKLVKKRHLKESTRARFLTKDEYERLMKTAGDIGPIIRLAVETGMRLGEILALKRDDIDLDQATIYIRQTKTDEPRVITIEGHTVSFLAELPRHFRSPLAFHDRDGKPLKVGNVSKRFRAVADRAGLNDVRFHDLRHTFASWQVQRGMDLYRLQRYLGHKGPAMTQRYAHLRPEDLRTVGTKPVTPETDFSD